MQYNLLANDEDLYTGVSLTVIRVVVPKSHQDRNGNVVVPSHSLENIVATVKSENRRRNAEKE
jgi:hypothetical protein